MSRGRILLLSLILIVGLNACYPRESPASVEADSPPVTVSSSPTSSLQPAATLETSTPAPTASSTVTPTMLACWSQGGRVEETQLEKAAWPETLHYRIYLPPCYDHQAEWRYPVLYLLHGQTYQDDQWDRLGVDEAADELIAAGEIPPLLIVMPREEDTVSMPFDNPFDEILIEGLIPDIDAAYRTRGERSYRAIGGLSRGGNWAVHLGLSRWQYFGSIGAHSAPTFVTDGSSKIRAWLEQIPAEDYPRIYLDSGQGDRWLESTLRFEALLTEEGIPHEWHLFSGAHDESYWAAHVEVYLRWYASAW